VDQYKDIVIIKNYTNLKYTMSEGSNHNLASEFRKHPDRAKWLLDKVLPAMEKNFEDFNVDTVVGILTDDALNAKKIKSMYSSYQKKQNLFQPKGVKRARPAYQFFCNEKRKELQEENEDLAFGDVNKMLGEMWGNLSDKERRPYEKKAEADKKRYREQFDDAEQKAIASGEYSPNPLRNIKKPRTSYLCYSTDPAIRKKYSKKAGGDIKELMRILGAQWKKMALEEKQPYVDLAEEDKLRYEKERAVALKKDKKLKESLLKNNNNNNNNNADANADANDDEDNDDEEEPVAKKSTKKPTSKSTKSTKSNKKKTTKKPKVKQPSVSSDEENDDDDE
jgi:hypothetical protein